MTSPGLLLPLSGIVTLMASPLTFVSVALVMFPLIYVTRMTSVLRDNYPGVVPDFGTLSISQTKAIILMFKHNLASAAKINLRPHNHAFLGLTHIARDYLQENRSGRTYNTASSLCADSPSTAT